MLFTPQPSTYKTAFAQQLQNNPLQHTTQTQYCSCTPQPSSTYKTTLLLIMPATLNCNKTWSQPQHNPLSIHNNMHYTPSTAHYTAFHAQDNPSVHTSNTWQNGTRCRDCLTATRVTILWLKQPICFCSV